MRSSISDERAGGEATEQSNLIQREILQLALLGVVAVAAFFLTRGIAASNHDMNLRDGAEWYQRGQRQLERGDVDNAIDSFRRASVRNRNEKRYVLALARALAYTHQYEAARSALLALRESAPEDAEVNLQLARLAADRQDVTEALRYYHNTLYAPWPADQTDARRRVRLELIDFLLTHDRPSPAVSELLALSTDLPDAAAAHVEVGQLFSKAGDSRRALEQFQRALRLAPGNGDALDGAGQAAFQLGDYVLAERYLRVVPNASGKVRETRDLVELVLSSDPLASRIRSAERRRRLIANFSYADQRLSACIEQRASATQPSADELALRQEAQAFETHLKAPVVGEDDTLDVGVDLIYRIEREVVQRCPSTLLDRALVLIGQKHGVDQR